MHAWDQTPLGYVEYNYRRSPIIRYHNIDNKYPLQTIVVALLPLTTTIEPSICMHGHSPSALDINDNVILVGVDHSFLLSMFLFL